MRRVRADAARVASHRAAVGHGLPVAAHARGALVVTWLDGVGLRIERLAHYVELPRTRRVGAHTHRVGHMPRCIRSYSASLRNAHIT